MTRSTKLKRIAYGAIALMVAIQIWVAVTSFHSFATYVLTFGVWIGLLVVAIRGFKASDQEEGVD